MLEWTHEDLVDTKASVGGVIGILRTLKVECLTSLTCLALRESDGTFSIATFPLGGAVPPWSLERIERVLEEIWADPTLDSGNVMIRASRRTNGNSAGPQLRIASAALRWSDDSAPPWGLVCLLDPLSGNFDQDQCDHLARSAAGSLGTSRRATRCSTSSRTWLAPRPHGSTTETTTETSTGSTARLGRRSLALTTLTDTPRFDAPAPRGDRRELRASSEVEEGQGDEEAQGAGQEAGKVQGKSPTRRPQGKKAAKKAQEQQAGPIEHRDPADRLADDVRTSELRLDVDELITMRAPSAADPLRTTCRDRPIGDDGYGGHEDALVSTRTRPSKACSARSEVDPITGLGGLPSLFGELGIALSAPRSESGCVVLTLLCFVPTRPVKTKLVNQVAVELGQTLRNHVRGDDAVFRIAESVFAVVTTLRSHAVFPENIQDRLNQALRFALASSQAPFEIRSSLVSTSDQEGGIGPELFFRGAMLDLEL